MKLATRCPACGAAFRVREAQLQASGGWVRCGGCQAAFQALDALFDPEHEDPPPRPAPGAAGTAPAAGGDRAAAPEWADEPARPGPPAEALPSSWDRLNPTQARHEPPGPDPADDPDGLRLAGRAAQAAGLSPPRAAPKPRGVVQGLRRLGLGLLALALLAALGLQGLRLQDGAAWAALAQAWPEGASALDRWHAALAPGATPPATAPASAGPVEDGALGPWRLDASPLQASADGHGQVLRLQFTLDGGQAAPAPALDLELLDGQGRTVQRQRLLLEAADPASAPPAGAWPPGSRVTLPVQIEPAAGQHGAVQLLGWRLRAARP